MLIRRMTDAEAEGALRLHVAGSRNAVGFYERAGFRLDPDTANEEPEISRLVRLLNGDC